MTMQTTETRPAKARTTAKHVLIALLFGAVAAFSPIATGGADAQAEIIGGDEWNDLDAVAFEQRVDLCRQLAAMEAIINNTVITDREGKRYGPRFRDAELHLSRGLNCDQVLDAAGPI